MKPIGIALLVALAATAAQPTVLGIDGARFTVDGAPTFLLGISYYGALGAEEKVLLSDLQALKAHGLNWIRVWATWNAFGNDVSAVDAAGDGREPYLSRLRWLVARCDELGMIVDVSLSHGLRSEAGTLLADFSSHSRAVVTVVEALRGHRNWYLDLANERNVGDSRFVSLDDIGRLRRIAGELAPELPVTASSGGEIGEDELGRYLRVARVDFIAPHRPRHRGTAEETKRETGRYLKQTEQAGRPVPVHYQEPFRRGYGDWEPVAEDFLADLQAAVASGAAGWCLHNGDNKRDEGGRPRRSFDLREGPLLAQLDAEETAVVAAMAQVVAGAR